MSHKNALGPAVSGLDDALFDSVTSPATSVEKVTQRKQVTRAKPKRERAPKPAPKPRSNIPADEHVRTSLDVPRDLHTRLKVASAKTRKPMVAILLEGVEAWLDANDH
ncbi:MAG: hypothetical protein K0U93_03225 [Gammaproteobacteria bacterium]|nr:hypothetical protein [Gammaproteobacteria bacterium]